MASYADIQLQYFNMLRESQYWRPEKMQEFQRAQLDILLRHARTNVPFYATRLDAVFRTDDTIDWERWRDLPIVERRDLAEHREAMQARSIPPGHGSTAVFHSSGSTGVPISITQNGLATIGSKAAEYRAFDWHGVDYTRTLVSLTGVEPDVGAWPEGRDRGQWGPFWDSGAARGKRWDINNMASNEQVLDFLRRKKATYLIAGATVVRSLALDALRLGIHVPLELVFIYGSAPIAQGREDVRKAFGARLVALYSAKEAHAVAHGCPTGTHYHVHAENLLVEVLNEAGDPCGPGETGRVVVTPFLSTAQPLIRYALGDLARAGGTCMCGRTLPVIEDLVGRTSQIFRFPDGTNVYRRIPIEIRRRLGAAVWQVAQIAPLAIEIRYEPSDWSVVGDEQFVAETVRAIFHPDVAVSFRRVERVPLTAAGKYIEYVNETEQA